MKILLAIDDSPCAEVAVREVEERFTMQDATVHVLHVIEKFVPPAALLWYDGVGIPKRRTLHWLITTNDSLMESQKVSHQSVFQSRRW